MKTMGFKKKKFRIGRKADFWLRLGGLTAIAVPVCCIAIAGVVGWIVSHPRRKPLGDDLEQYGLPRQDVEFLSLRGDVRLRGWHIPAANRDKRLVIFAHGYAENRTSNKPVLPLVRAFYDRGISSLLFDFRHSGESDSSVTSIGHFEMYDLLAALEWGKQNGYSEIAFVGFSMGAATAIIAAAKSKQVKAVVADSPFSDLESYLKENMHIWTKLPNIPFTYLMMKMIPRMTGIDVRQVQPACMIQELKHIPVLLIHNKGDTYISAEHSRKIFERSGPLTELWITDGETHVGSYDLDPEKYVHKVVGFVEKSFSSS